MTDGRGAEARGTEATALVPGPGAAPPHGDTATAALAELVQRTSGVLLGDTHPIRLAAATFLAGGHILFEDIPGVGKTLLAKALSQAIGGTFGRVQGTPDLLPSDLTGVSYLDDDTRSWTFRPGPLFHNVVLVDELNRATPRTQSALLEAMAEGHVTVDGVTHPLPDPFLVVATQNPRSGDLGTFPLVGGQRDRFSVSLSLGLPGRAAEMAVLAGQGGDHALLDLGPVAPLDHWCHLRATLDQVFVHPTVAAYLLDLVDSIRSRTAPAPPLSTRASLAVLRLARAHATAEGRGYVEPGDVQSVAVAGLAHRILDATDDDLPTARGWIEAHLRSMPVPPNPHR